MKITAKSPCFDCENHEFCFEYSFGMDDDPNDKEHVYGSFSSWCKKGDRGHIHKGMTKMLRKEFFDIYDNIKGKRIYGDIYFDKDHVPESLKEVAESIDFDEYLLVESDRNCDYYVERMMERWNRKEAKNLE